MELAAETGVANVSSLVSFLDPLYAVAFAILTEDGELVHANQGFLRILDTARMRGETGDVRSLFVHPTFAQLLSFASEVAGPVYRGIINVGNSSIFCRSLKGTVHRGGGQVLLVAEYDVVEMEALNAQVIELNEELAAAQREIARSNRKLRVSEARLRELSLTDPLTGLGNRRRLMDYLGDAIERYKRNQEPFSIVMADIDFFKKVNDTYGHDVGDDVLVAFARLLSSCIRSIDLVARLGGEEFVIVMVATPMYQAMQKAEQLRVATEQLSFANMQCGITGSFGVAEYLLGDGVDGLLKKVDECVYRAKHGGRNRVSAYVASRSTD